MDDQVGHDEQDRQKYDRDRQDAAGDRLRAKPDIGGLERIQPKTVRAADPQGDGPIDGDHAEGDCHRRQRKRDDEQAVEQPADGCDGQHQEDRGPGRHAHHGKMSEADGRHRRKRGKRNIDLADQNDEHESHGENAGDRHGLLQRVEDLERVEVERRHQAGGNDRGDKQAEEEYFPAVGPHEDAHPRPANHLVAPLRFLAFSRLSTRLRTDASRMQAPTIAIP